MMISSEDLRDMTTETFYLLAGGDSIFTDDEIPMEEVVTNMRDSLKENRKEFAKFQRQSSRFSDPQLIVLAKADFDRLHSFVDTNLSRSHESTENVTTDERCLFLNDIARRICVVFKDDVGAISEAIGVIANKVAHIPEDKTIAEVIDAILEIEDIKEEVKKMVGDIKNVVAFVPPITEDQVKEVK